MSNNEEQQKEPVDAKNKEEESDSLSADSRYRTLINTEYGFNQIKKEQHKKTLDKLREELNYINETDWMYEPLDKMPPI